MVNRTQADRKKEETHNKARTERLYSRLEEVQKRKVELDRKEQYTKNREKAKEFEQVCSCWEYGGGCVLTH